MNYKRIYDSIIENRLSNPLNESEYGERHHIIPKSLGGLNKKENIVKLSAREHFICHALLAEMYEENTPEWYKMNKAFMMMKSSNNDQPRYINSKLYELKRKDFSKVMSYSQSGSRNSQYGKTKSDETKNKISKSLYKTIGSHNKKIKLNDKYKHKKMHTIDGFYINNYRINTIRRIFNIELKNRCKIGFNELYDLLHNLYETKNMSTVEIANMLNTNSETIRNYLGFVRINRRTLSESIKNYNNNTTGA